MKKWKVPLVLILVVGLLCGFACLPKIVADIWDHRFGKSPSFNEIHAVQLDITQERQPMDFPDKPF